MWFYVDKSGFMSTIFGCPKFTFDHISGHFRSIRNFNFFWKFLTKWLPSVIFDVRNSLSIVFLAIADRLAILDFLNSLSMAFLAISDPYGFFRRPFWMSENHFRSHFWPFLIDRPYWMSKIHFRWHFWPFQIHTDLISFLNFGQNGRRRPFWMSENNFRSQFLLFQIDTQLLFF